MQLRSFGSSALLVSEFGLGCMGMSGIYGDSDRDESIKTIQAALDSGITLLNTGDFYGMGHNELLIGEAIKGKRDQAFISLKSGALRTPEGGFAGVDARPAALKNFLSYSLVRLGVDHIDLYQPCRVDPAVPIEETVGGIAAMVKSGKVRCIGLSEVSGKTLQRAHAVHPITAVEVEYSLMDRHIETDLLPVARELGVAVVAYGVLSRGLIQSSGQVQIKERDYRAHLPRFTGENFEKNRVLVTNLQELAERKGATAAQIAFAWVKGRGKDIFPLIGARTRQRLGEALGSASVQLTADDLALLEQWFSPGVVAGDRYPSEVMWTVNA